MSDSERRRDLGVFYGRRATWGSAAHAVVREISRAIERATGRSFEAIELIRGPATFRRDLEDEVAGYGARAGFAFPVVGPGFATDFRCHHATRTFLAARPAMGVFPIVLDGHDVAPQDWAALHMQEMARLQVWRIPPDGDPGRAARIGALARAVADRTAVASPQPAAGTGAVAYVARPRARGKGADDARLPLAWIPPGTFWMGSPEGVGDADERPRHRVRITHALLVGVTPVTQAQWRGVLDAAREAGLDLGELAGRKPHFEGARRPMESVSWYDARRWCDLLSGLEGRPAAYSTPTVALGAGGYRLPTEAEWEYLCRAGTTSRWSFGDDEERLAEHGWFAGNSGSETHPVGEKAPNPWGLYDAHGNVWEWCEDAQGIFYLPKRAPIITDDPVGTSGGWRMMRGGCYDVEAVRCRSAFQFTVLPVVRNGDLGFRVVRPVVPRADGG